MYNFYNIKYKYSPQYADVWHLLPPECSYPTSLELFATNFISFVAPEIFLGVGTLCVVLFLVTLRKKKVRMNMYLDQKIVAGFYFLILSLYVFGLAEVGDSLTECYRLQLPVNYADSYTYGMAVGKALFVTTVFFLLPCIMHAYYLEHVLFSEMFIFIAISNFCFTLLIGCDNLFNIFFLLEIYTLCAYVLVANRKGSLANSEAGFQYFVNAAYIGGIMFVGISMIYLACGTAKLSLIKYLLYFNSDMSPLMSKELSMYWVICVGLVFFVTGLVFKLGGVPFHYWMINVYDGAPVGSVVYLSGLTKFPLTCVLIQVTNCFDQFHFSFLYNCLVFCGILTIFVGSLKASLGNRLKTINILGSIATSGYILLAVGLATTVSKSIALAFGLLYPFTQVIWWGVVLQCLTFYVKDSILEYNSLTLRDLMKNVRRHPSLKYYLALVLFALSGLPPFNVFFLKWALIQSFAHEYLGAVAVFSGKSPDTVTLIVNLILVVFLVTGYLTLFYQMRQLKASVGDYLYILLLDSKPYDDAKKEEATLVPRHGFILNLLRVNLGLTLLVTFFVCFTWSMDFPLSLVKVIVDFL